MFFLYQFTSRLTTALSSLFQSCNGALIPNLLVKIDVGFIVPNAPGGEFDTALLAGLLGLLFIGPGRFSLDSMLGMETTAAPSRSLRNRVGTKQ